MNEQNKKVLFLVILFQNFNMLLCSTQQMPDELNLSRDYYTSLYTDPRDLKGETPSEKNYYISLSDGPSKKTDSLMDEETVVFDTPLRKKYYMSSIEEAMEKHWAVPISFQYMFANKGFNNDSSSTDLAGILFGKNPKIEDIYLLSKLANLNNIIKIDRTQFSPPLATPLPYQRPGSSVIDFGNYASDQYVALLAETELRIDTEQREFIVNISSIYQFSTTGDRALKQIGISMPLKSCLHIMDLNFVGGSLFTHGKLNVDNFSETPFSQFAKDFTSLRDFFERAILAPKGLTFEDRQRSSGIGDILLFGILDWAPYFNNLKSFQTGINLVLPTGGKINSEKIWAPNLGNGGALQVDIFTHLLFQTSSEFVNPNIRTVLELSAPFSGNVRVPKLKQNTSVPIVTGPFVRDSELLKDGTEFQSYYVNLFEEFDSTVALFADQAVCASTQRGIKVLIGGGNSIHNIFMTNLSFSFQYNYSMKWKDKITIDKSLGTFNTETAINLTDSNAHTIGFKFHYNSDNNYIIDFGTQHVIWGKNTPQFHDIFLTLAVAF